MNASVHELGELLVSFLPRLNVGSQGPGLGELLDESCVAHLGGVENVRGDRVVRWISMGDNPTLACGDQPFLGDGFSPVRSAFASHAVVLYICSAIDCLLNVCQLLDWQVRNLRMEQTYNIADEFELIC